MSVLSESTAAAVRAGLAAIDPAPTVAALSELEQERAEIDQARSTALARVAEINGRLAELPAETGARLAASLRRGDLVDERQADTLRAELSSYRAAAAQLERDRIQLDAKAHEAGEVLRSQIRSVFEPLCRELAGEAAAALGRLHAIEAAALAIHAATRSHDALQISTPIRNALDAARHGRWAVAAGLAVAPQPPADLAALLSEARVIEGTSVPQG